MTVPRGNQTRQKILIAPMIQDAKNGETGELWPLYLFKSKFVLPSHITEEQSIVVYVCGCT
jgi:hypothetical protein